MPAREVFLSVLNSWTKKLSEGSAAKCRGERGVGSGRGSWAWVDRALVWVNVVGKKKV